MADKNLYLVDAEVIRQRYTHHGIYGKGHDIIRDLASTIHIIQDNFIFKDKQSGKLVSMQIFANLTEKQLESKVNSITKAGYKFYVPFYQTILMLSYKKNENKTFDLMVLYDFDDLEPFVDIIKSKKQLNSLFQEQEIWDIIYLLIDSIHMGSSLTSEFTDLSPVNIFYNHAEKTYILSNFGLELPLKVQKCVHCPSDQFYVNKLEGKKTVMELYKSSQMFQIGMIALYLLTLEEPNELYLDFNHQEMRSINPVALQNRIKSVQELGISDKLMNFLNYSLKLNEDERLDLNELFSDGKQLLPRQEEYFQGQLADAKDFSGFVETKENQVIPHGIGDITLNDDQKYIGMLEHSAFTGYGILYDGQKKFIFGKWSNDDIKQGIIIKKNESLYFGSINQFEPIGEGILINLAANLSADYFYFEGVFNENHQPSKGVAWKKNREIVEIDVTKNQNNQQKEQQKEQKEQSQIKDENSEKIQDENQIPQTNNQ